MVWCKKYIDLFLNKGDGGENIDQLMDQWPVRASLHNALNKIGYDFEACPLAVYVDERFVLLVDVQGILRGALVKVTGQGRRVLSCTNFEASIQWSGKLDTYYSYKGIQYKP